jgi:dihydroorotate dehydrogenase
MLHTGHPNAGFNQVVRKYAEYWARSEVPIIVHLLVEDDRSLQRMVERLEGMENVAAIELGFPPQVDQGHLDHALRLSAGELPLIARLPFELSVGLAEAAIHAGAAAVSLSPPRVLLPVEHSFASGRMYGRAVFPLLLERVRLLRTEDIPLIAGGGVYTVDQAKSLISLGVRAVQLDAALWREPEILFGVDN